MATAGSIVVDLLMRTGSFETDSKRAERRMKQMEREINKLAKTTTMYAVGAASAFALAMKASANYMDEIGDAAERTSVSAEAFSGLAYAANNASLSQGELERVLRRSTEAINHGAAGTGKQAEALRDLGISAYDATGGLKSADEMLLDMAEKFSELEPGARKTGLVLELFGQQLGQKVIPLLNNGRDGIKQLTDEARRFGLVVDDQAVRAAGEFNDNLDRLAGMAKGLAIGFANDLLPVLNDYITYSIDAAEETDGVLSSARELAGDQALPDWLNLAGRGFAMLIDVAVALGKAVNVVALAFRAVVADADLAVKAIPGVQLLDNILGDGNQLENALRKRNDTVAQFNDSLADLWNYPGDRNVQAWDKAIAKGKFDQNFVGPPVQGGTLPAIPVTPPGRGGGSSRSVQTDEGQRLIDQMNERIALIGKETEYEKLLARVSIDAITFKSEAQKQEALAMAQMLDEMEKARRAAEDFQSLMHQLYPERQAADDLAEQLATLQWAFEDGALAADGYAEAINKAIEQSLEKMPEIQGLSVHITGGDAELERLEKEEERLNEWYENQLAKLAEFREQKAEMMEEWDARELELKEQHEATLDQIENAKQVARLASTEAMFGELSGLAKSFAGEQSGIYKALFAVEKAYAIAKLMINAPKTASDAYNAVVGIPVVGPALAPVAAAAALAYQVGQIASVQSVGMAHDGIHSVPETGTWLLEKGERVLTSDTSARLDAMLARAERGLTEPPVVESARRSSGLTVNLIENPDRGGEVESSTNEDGEEELNIFVADIRGGGRRSQALEMTYGLRRVGA